MGNDARAIDLLCAQLQDQCRAGRGNDIHAIVHNVFKYIPAVMGDCAKGIEEIKRPENQDPAKHLRGWEDHLTARLLCPRSALEQFDEDRDGYCSDVLGGQITITANEWPTFLYPPNCDYNRQTMDKDLLRNHLLVACFRHIFTGQRTASREEPGPAGGRKSVAEKVHMTRVSPRNIAYVCVLVRHALNARTSWDTNDGHFSNVDFFHNIVDLFDEPEGFNDWSKSTLQWWNKAVFGSSYSGHSREPTDGPDDINALKAQRAARYKAAEANSAASGSTEASTG